MNDEIKNENPMQDVPAEDVYTAFEEPVQEPVPEAPQQSTSVFSQTVFGATQQNVPNVEPVQPEPVRPEPTVNPYSGSYYTQQNIPPYGQQAPKSAPVYGQPQANPNPYYGTTQPNYGYTPYNPTPVQPPKKDRKGLKVFFGILIAAVILGLLIACINLAKGNRSNVSEGSTTSSGATVDEDAPVMETKPSPSSDASAKSGQVLTPTQIAAKVRESSVAILVYSNKSSSVSSEGSGVLWKEDDSHTYTYIITCAHVIKGTGQTYTVQTENGKTYDAEMVGADSKTDLGVLRVKATGLKLAEFGDSGALQVGDPVYAIGNPGGTEFFGSFTSGIVSAIDRSIKSTYTMVCIQHTAAINPGNSGGALVNQYGQVIGINSQKIISNEYEGMGFAIPIKSAEPIINNLAANGYVKDRPRLGITYAEAVNYQQYSMIIKIKGMPSGSLIIHEIDPESSLANTEARQYDMIIAVDGKKLTTPDVLLDKIENGKVGDKLRLTLCRIDNNYQTKEFDVTVTLIEESRDKDEEQTTASSAINPYDFFNDDFFNGLF